MTAKWSLGEMEEFKAKLYATEWFDEHVNKKKI